MIEILLKDGTQSYEQDIRELAMAFCPGEPFVYEEKTEARLSVRARRVEDGEFAILVIEKDADTGGEKRRFEAGFKLTEDRRDNKSAIKTALYEALKELTGRELPWGTLTGIRPVKLIERQIAEGKDDREIGEHMKSVYLISDEKLNLITDIARRQERVLSGLDYKNGWSLYIGIAFCPTTCLYCSFTSYPIEKWRGRLKEYLDCIRKELRLISRCTAEEGNPLFGRRLQTVYVGGGTPTSLPEEYLRELMEIIYEETDMSSVAEFTVEAGRPDSLSPEKLDILREFNVGRISINPQTMNQKTLELIGRRHSVEDVKKAFHMARKKGFDNINMDLIMGLPGEDISDVRHTLKEIEELSPDSLTVHALAIKRAARLNTERDNWVNVARAAGDEASLMTELGRQCALGMGMVPYYLYRQKNMAGNQENVGYAGEDKVNLYNILMMEELHTVIGVGAGSSSTAVIENADMAMFSGNENRVERFENMKNVSEYMSRIDELLDKKESFLRTLS